MDLIVVSEVQNKFDVIISDLHRIVETEYTSIELNSPNKLKLTELLININSFGLLTKEVAETLVKLYYTDQDFRRLWGSISTQFSFLLELKYGIDTQEFAELIIKFLNIESRQNIEIGSFTTASILESRIGTEGYAGAKLTSINDFWIICFFTMRLTMQNSSMIQSTLEKIHEEVNLAGQVYKSARERFEQRMNRNAVKIKNVSPPANTDKEGM